MNKTCRIVSEMQADVTVIGGGTAGVFAAVAAAKSGAKTLLIEKNSILGGTVTVASVNYPGLFFAWGERVIGGPCWEAIERTVALGGAVIPPISYKPQYHWQEQIRLNRFVFTAVLFEMCEEAGVEVLCNAMIADAAETDGGLDLTVAGKNGLFVVHSRTAVDATGDANLAQIMGLETVKSETLQPATLQNRLSGYDLDTVDFEQLRQVAESADLPALIGEKNLVHYLHAHTIDMHIPCLAADTSAGKTALEKQAIAHTLAVYRVLKTVRGLEGLEIDFAACETGVRETNRIVGEHVITADEYIRGENYPDAVCYAFYPIDLHVMEGVRKTYHADGVVSQIPYTALIPKGAERVLCAGRCISSDTNANSAVRVEATCMATGQAAGCAAAIAAKSDCPVGQVNYNELCEALTAIGAIVPQS